MASEKKIKVLIVDSVEVCRRMLKNMLIEDSDLEIVGEAESPQAAILMLDEYEPEVVMLAIKRTDKMTVVSAIAQLVAIKPDLHIILCMDKIDIPEAESTVRTANVDFVAKPYQRETVIRAIKDWIPY